MGLYNESLMAEIPRRQTVPVKVGNVWIGGQNPIAVQSMTNTDTADVASTAAQVEALAAAGSELVRITVNTREAAIAVPAIVNRLRSRGIQASRSSVTSTTTDTFCFANTRIVQKRWTSIGSIPATWEWAGSTTTISGPSLKLRLNTAKRSALVSTGDHSTRRWLRR